MNFDARMIQPRYGMKCGVFYAYFLVQQVARYGSVISYRSVHLDARKISPRSGIKCGGFLCVFFEAIRRCGVDFVD